MMVGSGVFDEESISECVELAELFESGALFGVLDHGEQDHVDSDADGISGNVPGAGDGGLSLECAAEVISTVDHDVPAIDSESFEEGFSFADFRRQSHAACSAGRHDSAFDLADVVPEFESKDLVIDGDAFEFGIGIELSNHASEAVVERFGSTDGIGEQQSTVVEVGFELSSFGGSEVEPSSAMHEDDGVAKQCGVGDREFESSS